VTSTTVAHEDARPPPKVPWWKLTTVYQIYPRSFCDANGDGIGDLAGVIARLDYLRELGVETLWLSPFFDSPQVDFGYDVRDHFAVAPEYGSLDDCRHLIDEVHARGMKIVFDMVLNHTSDQNPWFLESRSSRGSARREWFIWRDGRKPRGKAPPNNWRSLLGGSGWRYDRASEQWYWASFLGCQPDLNYRNPDVKEAMLGVVRYWLGQGVDGLRLDIFNALFKDASFADNPFSWRPAPSLDNPHGFFQHHRHTIDHPDTIAFARELRAVVDEFHSPERFLVGEVVGNAASLRRYCGEAANGLHLVFLFQTLGTHFSGRRVRALIKEIEGAFPEPFSPTYVLGNHDRPRFIERVKGHLDKAKLLAMLQLTVRGVPFIYYGEEIGMENHDIPLHEGLDPLAARFSFVPQWVVAALRKRGILLNRDECRGPMQWDAGPNCGFAPASASPWLPVHPRSAACNVAAQRDDRASVLNCYRSLLALRRRHPALQVGSLEPIDDPRLPRKVVAYRRTLATGDRPEVADVLLNFSRRETTVELGARAGRMLFSNRCGETLPARPSYVLRPYEGVVLVDADV
jgi:alpha-glucosidase